MRRATLALALAAALGGAGGASLTGEPSRGSQTARAVVTGPPYAVGETQVTFVATPAAPCRTGQPPRPRKLVTVVRNTDLFFAAAHRPKYLVHLFGAPHLPPYTYEEPQLSFVERATIAFLDRYLKHGRNGLSRIRRAAARPGVAGLIAPP